MCMYTRFGSGTHDARQIFMANNLVVVECLDHYK